MTTTQAGRGALTIAEQAVERLAAHAVLEVDDIGEAVKASARVDGGTVALDVRLPIGYPASVARTAGRAREHLVRRVRDLTGLAVTRVDLTVTALPTAAAPARRVE